MSGLDAAGNGDRTHISEKSSYQPNEYERYSPFLFDKYTKMQKMSDSPTPLAAVPVSRRNTRHKGLLGWIYRGVLPTYRGKF